MYSLCVIIIVLTAFYGKILVFNILKIVCAERIVIEKIVLPISFIQLYKYYNTDVFQRKLWGLLHYLKGLS